MRRRQLIVCDRNSRRSLEHSSSEAYVQPVARVLVERSVRTMYVRIVQRHVARTPAARRFAQPNRGRGGDRQARGRVRMRQRSSSRAAESRRSIEYGPRVELPAWIASELPAGARDREIATRGERMHLLEWVGFPLGVLHTSRGDRSTIRGDVARAYRWPLRKRRDRAAPLALARMVPDSATAHPSLIALGRVDATFRSAAVPISLVWGTRDPILGRVINHLERMRPDAKIVRTGAGHFLQEEVPVELADAVLDVAARADWS